MSSSEYQPYEPLAENNRRTRPKRSVQRRKDSEEQDSYSNYYTREHHDTHSNYTREYRDRDRDTRSDALLDSKSVTGQSNRPIQDDPDNVEKASNYLREDRWNSDDDEELTWPDDAKFELPEWKIWPHKQARFGDEDRNPSPTRLWRKRYEPQTNPKVPGGFDDDAVDEMRDSEFPRSEKAIDDFTKRIEKMLEESKRERLEKKKNKAELERVKEGAEGLTGGIAGAGEQ
jgi:hypothetical protein